MPYIIIYYIIFSLDFNMLAFFKLFVTGTHLCYDINICYILNIMTCNFVSFLYFNYITDQYLNE